jgi:hypothetical protein
VEEVVLSDTRLILAPFGVDPAPERPATAGETVGLCHDGRLKGVTGLASLPAGGTARCSNIRERASTGSHSVAEGPSNAGHRTAQHRPAVARLKQKCMRLTLSSFRLPRAGAPLPVRDGNQGLKLRQKYADDHSTLTSTVPSPTSKAIDDLDA